MEGFWWLLGSWGPKVVDWPVASWADKPLTSFGVAFGSLTLACFLVIMTWRGFGPWSPYCDFGFFGGPVGSFFGLWSTLWIGLRATVLWPLMVMGLRAFIVILRKCRASYRPRVLPLCILICTERFSSLALEAMWIFIYAQYISCDLEFGSYNGTPHMSHLMKMHNIFLRKLGFFEGDP